MPELFGRLTILDKRDRTLMTLGENRGLPTHRPNWPNELQTEPGLFTAPHSCAIDLQGDIYVVEWRVGGRIIKLEKQ